MTDSRGSGASAAIDDVAVGGELLDPEAARHLLAAGLDRRAPELGEVRPVRLWFKPGRRLTVRYNVVIAGCECWAALWAERGQAVRAMVFPDDPFLPGTPRPPDDGQPLAWKPRARSVVRVGDAVVKAFGDDGQYEAAARALRSLAGAPFPTGRLRAIEPGRRTVQEFVAGEKAQTERDARQLGTLVRRLHDWPVRGLRAVGGDTLLVRAVESARVLTTVRPDIGGEVQALLARLAARVPGDDVRSYRTSHGDYDAGQILIGADGEATMIDVDELCAAPPAFDLANYAVHALRDTGDVAAVEPVVDDLVAGYGERPADLAWFLAACSLIRAPDPFRTLHREWRTRVVTKVSAASTLLDEAPR